MSNSFLVSFPGLGIHDIAINRVAFTLFGIEVYWYGLLIATAVIAGLLMAYKAAPRFGINPDTVLDTMIALVPMMIICARLYYVVFSWDEFKDNPVNILNLRTGGLAYYGGVIGGVLAMLLIARIRHVNAARLMDLMVVYVPLGQGIGRWGNFFNQEAFGSNTTLPWGMISNGTSDYLSRTGTGDPLIPVHPTFLYEFIANMIIFVILIYVRKKSSRPFVTTATYLMLYGLVRFFVESIRTDSLYIGHTSIRVSMMLSAVLFAGALVVLILLKLRPVKAIPVQAADAGKADDGTAEENSAENGPADSGNGSGGE